MLNQPRVIQLKFNKLYKPVFTTTARYVDIWGGRARGGSHFATDYFLFLITKPGYFRGVFLRAIFGDIRDSLWKDFKDRVEAAVDAGQVKMKDFVFNDSKMSVVYTPTGNNIISKGFKKSSGQQSAKLKSIAGATHVIIEECEEVSEDDFSQLDDTLRTNKVEQIQVVRLFNPPSKNHWLIKRFYNLYPSMEVDRDGNLVKGWYRAMPKDMPELLSIHSTFEDNIKNVNASTIKNYHNYGNPESPFYKPDYYYRNVRGLVSEGKKGRIFTNVRPIPLQLFNSLPYPSFYGLDFGFNDPNAVVELKYHDGKLFAHELIYQSGLDNDELAARMKVVRINKARKVYADSARPDNIKSLNKYGFIVIGADKGPNSIEYGYRELLNLQIHYTDCSSNLEKEFEEHSWQLDKDKEPTDVPEDDNNHLIDGIRYAYTMHCKKSRPTAAAPNDSRDDWEAWTDDDYRQAEPLDEDDVEEFYNP